MPYKAKHFNHILLIDCQSCRIWWIHNKGVQWQSSEIFYLVAGALCVLFLFFYTSVYLLSTHCGCKMENFTLTPNTSVNFFIYRNRRVCSQFVSKNIYTLLICLEMIINIYFIESGNLRWLVVIVHTREDAGLKEGNVS